MKTNDNYPKRALAMLLCLLAMTVTAQSLHLWLPIGFDAQGTPIIPWADSPF